MKYLNIFDEFLNEEYKHVNNDVIHYKNDLITLFETQDFKNKTIEISVDLNSRNSLKLSNLKIKIDINPVDFENYGYFKKGRESKIENLCLIDCFLYLQLQLSNNEIKDNKISPFNKIHSLLNHELNHSLEIYQYEYNNKRYRYSWELVKKQIYHREFSNKYQYWKDFNYLIYLGLNHEMSSRLSEIYEEIKKYENIEEDIKNNKIFQDAKFMLEFDFDVFYKLFVDKYGENEFIKVCEQFCKDFQYDFHDDLDFCKKMIQRIIKSLNRKGEKILKKIQNVIKRVEQEKNGITFEGYYNQDIDYEQYLI